MVIKAIIELLKGREFVSVATVGKNGEPNAAPKFILKIETPFIYLVDYTIAQTVENLKINPRASLSFMDIENLEGYRLNGAAELIERGQVFDALSQELHRRIVKLSASRVIEGMRSGKKSGHFELEMPDRFVVLKIRIKDAAKIGSRGGLWKEKSLENGLSFQDPGSK